MSPWDILEWVVAVGLSVVTIMAIIFGTAIGTRYLVHRTTGRFWVKKTTRKTPTTKK